MFVTPPPTLQRSTRRSARSNSTAVQALASPEAAIASSSLQTEVVGAASASAVTADFSESDYATPARPSAPEATSAVGANLATEEKAITRNRGTRVPASASPVRARSPKGEGSKSKVKSVVRASVSAASGAIATSASSPLSVGAINTVTPPDSIKTIKMAETPVVAVKIDSAAAAAVNNNSKSTNDGDSSDKQLRIGKKEEPETSSASAITKEKEDSERNKTSAPDDNKVTTAPVESSGDGINISNSGNNGGNKSQRGLVSRRGRFISPGRRLQPVAAAAPATVHSPPSRNISNSNNNNTDSVIEYKTYRSPSRKRDEEVPSLCSTGSGHLTGISTRSVAENEVKSAPAPKPPASSISCDPSMIDSTSPLASHEHADERKQPASAKKPAATGASSRSQTPPRETADTVRLILALLSLSGEACFYLLRILFAAAYSLNHFLNSLFYSPRNPLQSLHPAAIFRHCHLWTMPRCQAPVVTFWRKVLPRRPTGRCMPGVRLKKRNETLITGITTTWTPSRPRDVTGIAT
jgi:hypothetical protein